MLTGYELAKQFYERHELDFTRAAVTPNTDDMQFPYSDDKMDDFLVSVGELTTSARDANDEVTRAGVIMSRNHIRRRLNGAAKKDKRLPRRFSIEVRDKRTNRYRVLLLERYVAERPEQIARSFQRSLSFTDRSFVQAGKYLEQQDYLPDDERLLIASQLAYGRMQVFGILNTVTLWIKSVEDGQAPDLRTLQRQFASLVNSGGKIVPRSYRAPRRRRLAVPARPAVS